jgi:hypothetical protein
MPATMSPRLHLSTLSSYIPTSSIPAHLTPTLLYPVFLSIALYLIHRLYVLTLLSATDTSDTRQLPHTITMRNPADDYTHASHQYHCSDPPAGSDQH